jgi:cell division protein FtsL
LQWNEYKQHIMLSVSQKVTTLRQQYAVASEQAAELKEMARQRWHALLGIEKMYVTVLLSMAVLVVIQFFWIIALQYQVSTLSDLTDRQETRIARLEKASDKHNNLLYEATSTVWDIKEKWSDLNFRVLQNTWKLDDTK